MAVLLRLPNRYTSEAVVVTKASAEGADVSRLQQLALARRSMPCAREVLSRPRLQSIIDELGIGKKGAHATSDQLIERARHDV